MFKINKKRFTLKAMRLAFLLLVAFFIWPNPILAAQDVVINEIAWMGTKASSADEWIELLNNSDHEIILDDWILQEGSGETIIRLQGKIASGGYFLIERTDDSAVSDVTADLFGSWGGSGLSNSGEIIFLKDSGLNSVDEVDCSGGWFAGVASPDYKTMERVNSHLSGLLASNWATNDGLMISGFDAKSNPVQGTPKAKNSAASASTTPSIIPSASPPPTATSTPAKSSSPSSQITGPVYQYSNDVLISEFMPNPGPDANEWVELYNAGVKPVSLYGWEISDSPDIENKQKIPEGSFINPHGFFVVGFQKDFFSNEGDQIRLTWPDGQTIHTVSYPGTLPGLACARFTESHWQWTNQPTPNQTNKETILSSAQKNEQIGLPLAKSKNETISQPIIISSLQKSPTPPSLVQERITESPIQPKEEPLAKPENADLTAAVSQPTVQGKKENFLFLLITVVCFSGAAALGLVYFRRQKNPQTNTRFNPPRDDDFF